MFRIGNIVQHKQTRKVGRVVGYGFRLTASTYFLILKVKPLKQISFRNIEDAFGKWHFVRYLLLIVVQSPQRKLAA
ncbi:hypothetical protein [Myxosarcina sp. GI1]|uniref:hypothetical protein n=1 Tax=Myxosarcina sp. GI1 TaxID=1541065 RepID=UPI0005667ABA|nr:hypothetical protein [Myxosarcina sp. GI1]